MADFVPLQPKNKSIVCPNHAEPLEGLPNPLTPKGTGRCPISGCHFSYVIDMEAESTAYEKDHNGNLKAVPVYKVLGEEK